MSHTPPPESFETPRQDQPPLTPEPSTSMDDSAADQPQPQPMQPPAEATNASAPPPPVPGAGDTHQPEMTMPSASTEADDSPLFKVPDTSPGILFHGDEEMDTRPPHAKGSEEASPVTMAIEHSARDHNGKPEFQIEAGSSQMAGEGSGSSESLNVVTHYPPSPPASKMGKRKRKVKRRDPSPRFLVICFCVWLLGAWFVALDSTSMVRPIQWMVLCAFFCVMAFWPVLRLSQFRNATDLDESTSADSFRSPGRLFIDWLCLNLVFQTIIWPLHLNAQWHHSQTMWISATLASWSLITGAIVAMGCRSDRPLHRTLAATLCMLLLVGEPLIRVLPSWLSGGRLGSGWLRGEGGEIAFFTSPLALIWELTSPAVTWGQQLWVTQVPAIALAGVTAWLVVVATRRWAGASSEPLPHSPRTDATLR